MKYFGGKIKLAKEIVSLLEYYRQLYKLDCIVDLFGGGGNITIEYVKHYTTAPVIYNEKNKYIAAWLERLVVEDFNDNIDYFGRYLELDYYTQVGVEYEKYTNLLRQNKVDKNDYAFVGWFVSSCSFTGKWIGGFARDSRGRNYYRCAFNRLKRELAILNKKNIKVFSKDYRYVPLPKRALVYCDPPYIDTINGYQNKTFSPKEFKEWAEKKAKTGALILVSGNLESNKFYNWSVVWIKNYTRGVRGKSGRPVKVTECILSPNKNLLKHGG